MDEDASRHDGRHHQAEHREEPLALSGRQNGRERGQRRTEPGRKQREGDDPPGDARRVLSKPRQEAEDAVSEGHGGNGEGGSELQLDPHKKLQGRNEDDSSADRNGVGQRGRGDSQERHRPSGQYHLPVHHGHHQRAPQQGKNGHEEDPRVSRQPGKEGMTESVGVGVGVSGVAVDRSFRCDDLPVDLDEGRRLNVIVIVVVGITTVGGFPLFLQPFRAG
mmetsp:Transcript_18307/g.42159  ORF Transcript_18307/g.42159 Transcript_18307/m.42159 type:complete len:220 (+) Transcript_18307:1188-1847(+)